MLNFLNAENKEQTKFILIKQIKDAEFILDLNYSENRS